MDQTTHMTVSEVIAERLPAIRAANSKIRRQDDLAFQMSAWMGAPWSRATVAAVETGKREVHFDELLALSVACEIHPFEWFAGDGWVLITPGVGETLGTLMTRRALRASLGSGEFLDPASEIDLHGHRFGREHEDLIHGVLIQEVVRSIWPEGEELPTVKDPQAAARDSNKAVEQRTAARLGVKPLALAALAHVLWGHGVTEERDRRVSERVEVDATDRTIQALRGHVTRELINELQGKLKEAGR